MMPEHNVYLTSVYSVQCAQRCQQASCNQYGMSTCDSVARHFVTCTSASFQCYDVQAIFSDAVDTDRAARDLQRVMKRRQLAPQEALFTAGSPSEVPLRSLLHLTTVAQITAGPYD